MTEDEFNKLILIALVRPEVLPLIIEEEAPNKENNEEEDMRGREE